MLKKKNINKIKSDICLLPPSPVPCFFCEYRSVFYFVLPEYICILIQTSNAKFFLFYFFTFLQIRVSFSMCSFSFICYIHTRMVFSKTTGCNSHTHRCSCVSRRQTGLTCLTNLKTKTRETGHSLALVLSLSLSLRNHER